MNLPTGHLLPMDCPSTALEMIIKFMSGESFADTMLPSEHTYFDKVEGDSESQSELLSLAEEQERQAVMRALAVMLGVGLLVALMYYTYQKR